MPYYETVRKFRRGVEKDVSSHYVRESVILLRCQGADAEPSFGILAVKFDNLSTTGDEMPRPESSTHWRVCFIG